MINKNIKTNDMQYLRDQLFLYLPKNMSKEEEEYLTKYIEHVIEKISPIYTYLEDINQEKTQDIISIIDYLRSGKNNDD